MPALDSTFYLLILAGAAIGIFAVVVGGGMFVSIPIIQGLFPSASVGAVVGNSKVGAFFRMLGSTLATRKQIEWLQIAKCAPLALVGTVLGATIISNIDQRWMLPAIVCAMIFTVYAPKFAARISPKTFIASTFIIGFYTGVFGAGVSIMLVALLRMKYPEDKSIAHVKIQARFLEFILTSTAVLTHIFNGNLIVLLWLPLALGGFIGGYIGGQLLHKMGELSGNTQKKILYAAFAVDLIIAGKKFFE